MNSRHQRPVIILSTRQRLPLRSDPPGPIETICAHITSPPLVSTSLIGLLIILAVGCSKMTSVEEAEVRQSFGVPADMPMKDLGAVELRAGIPKRVSVGWGEDCTITATVLTNGLVQMNLVYESKGEVIDGVKTQPYSEQSQVVLPAGLLARAMKANSWLCFPPMRPHFVVAMQPIVVQ